MAGSGDCMESKRGEKLSVVKDSQLSRNVAGSHGKSKSQTSLKPQQSFMFKYMT